MRGCIRERYKHRTLNTWAQVGYDIVKETRTMKNFLFKFSFRFRRCNFCYKLSWR